MTQPGYVSNLWVSSRLGISSYRFRQLVAKGAFPQPDLTLGRTRLWRLADLVGRFPGLSDPTPPTVTATTKA